MVNLNQNLSIESDEFPVADENEGAHPGLPTSNIIRPDFEAIATEAGLSGEYLRAFLEGIKGERDLLSLAPDTYERLARRLIQTAWTLASDKSPGSNYIVAFETPKPINFLLSKQRAEEIPLWPGIFVMHGQSLRSVAANGALQDTRLALIAAAAARTNHNPFSISSELSEASRLAFRFPTGETTVHCGFSRETGLTKDLVFGEEAQRMYKGITAVHLGNIAADGGTRPINKIVNPKPAL